MAPPSRRALSPTSPWRAQSLPAKVQTGLGGEVSPLFERTGYPAAPYYYAGDGFHTPEKWYCISGEFEVGNPTLSTASGTHSLGEVAAATPNVEYTSEIGWQRNEGFGARSRLFIYINKDKYKSNGEPGGDCYYRVTPRLDPTPKTRN